MDRRTDYKTALLIHTIVNAPLAPGQHSPAQPSPARELARLGVPFDVARRVLTKPAERRHQFPSRELPTDLR